MTLFDLLPAFRLAHPLLIRHPAAELKNTDIERIILGKSGMLLANSMLEIIPILLLTNLTILTIRWYNLNPLIFGLQSSHHQILLNPLIEHVSMIIFIHLVEVLTEMMVTV